MNRYGSYFNLQNILLVILIHNRLYHDIADKPAGNRTVICNSCEILTAYNVPRYMFIRDLDPSSALHRNMKLYLR